MASWFDSLTAPFNASIGTDAAAQAAAAQQAGITQGYNQLSDLYGQGRGALQTNFMAGLQPFLNNYSGPGGAQAGTTALGNALGLGGPAGNVSATQAFWNNPAINSQIATGTQNVLRTAAGQGGGTTSGATLAALQNLAQNTAAGGWQNYVSNLTPYLNYSTGTATGIGNLYSGLGTGLNQSYTGQGQAAAGASAASGAAQANADLAAAQSQYGAGGNLWGAILGAGNLAAKFSDIRLKDDVSRVGTLNDGIPIYRYRLKGSPRTEIGVMAQDVEQVEPEAVYEHPSGFKMVDYDAATRYSAGIDKFMRMAA